MNWRVIIRPRAESDLREARLWYESRQPGLGDDFLMEARRAILLLETQADRQPLYYLDFRRVITRRFPYKIFYSVVGERVIVFRILHVKREHLQHLS